MKRILLIATAALMAGTAGAQALLKAQAKAKQPVAASVQKLEKSGMAPFKMMPMQTGGKASVLLGRQITMTAAEMATAKAPRKVAGLLDEWSCYGKDYETSKSVEWSMSSYESEDGDLFLVDVIPNPTTLDYLMAEVDLRDKSMKLLPQPAFSYTHTEDDGSTSTYYVFLAGANNADGSIEFTINDDGSLNAGSDEEIGYFVFDENKFDPEYTQPSNGGHYLGYYEVVSNLQYLLPGMVPAPVALYAPEGVNLNITLTPAYNWYGRQFTIMPANVPAVFANYTEGSADAFSWYVSVDDGEDEITSNETDLTFVPTLFSSYTIPELVASLKDSDSDPFTWSDGGLVLGSGAADMYLRDPADIIVTNANMDYNFSPYSYLGTPDVNSNGYSFSKLIAYQGKPTAPLYFEGISFFVYDYHQLAANVRLTCKIVKATRTATGQLELGDEIATANLDTESMTIIPESESSKGRALFTWTDFKALDEFGFQTSVEYLQIEDEFAIVFEGWDNGTFNCYPIAEYANLTDQLTSTYITVTGADDDVLGFQNMKNRLFVGYINATYGSLYTADNTNVVIPVEGGSATLRVEPLYSSSDDEGNSVTALWLADDYELPEWIEVTIQNEVYTQEDYYFDMTITADALPAGVESRTEVIDFYQFGAKLTVTVSQGATQGITATVKRTPVSNGAAYSITGRKIGKAQKGIMIKDSKKFLVK